jgi:uncharacterized protein YcgI (DUF1989 family)
MALRLYMVMVHHGYAYCLVTGVFAGKQFFKYFMAETALLNVLSFCLLHFGN